MGNPTDFPDGISMGGCRLFSNQATVIEVDNGSGGDGNFRVRGSLYAGLGKYPNNEPGFKYDRLNKQVTVGYLNAGYRSPTGARFIFNGATANLQGPTSTATSAPIDTQSLFLFQPTYWDGTKNVEANANITARATTTGGVLFIFEVPGREVMYLDIDGLRIMANVWPDQPASHLSGGVAGKLELGGGTTLDQALKLAPSTLPTADASHRGEIRRVDGGTGVADVLYICQKAADDTYSWQAL